jgi:hypothetical protein
MCTFISDERHSLCSCFVSEYGDGYMWEFSQPKEICKRMCVCFVLVLSAGGKRVAAVEAVEVCT